MVPLKYFIPEFYMNPILSQKCFYKFRTTTTTYNERRYAKEVSCERDIEISYLGKVKDLFVFYLFVSNVTLKSKNAVANENLRKKDIYAFGNIAAGVNEKGEIVKIFNIEKMQQNWEITKKELRKDYLGFEFEIFLEGNTNVLANESKVIYFANTKFMYGLFFHRLFGKNDIYNVPIRRKETLLDFDYSEITEEIYTDSRGPEFIIAAQKSKDQQENIISSNEEIKKYEGKILYNHNNILGEAFLEIESENRKETYNICLLESKVDQSLT